MNKKISLIIVLLLSLSYIHAQEAYYELDVTGYVNDGGRSCGSQRGLQWMKLIYEDGSGANTRYFDPSIYENKPLITPTVKFKESNKIRELVLHTNRRRKKLGDCKSTRRTRSRFINNNTCVDDSFTFGELGLSVGGNARILIKPVVKLSDPGINNNFGSEDYLRIPAINGINKNYYNWEYGFSPTGPFRALPAYTAKKNYLRVRGKDFLDPVNDHGKMIYFRVNTGCDGVVSNTISYRFLGDAPAIRRTNSKQTACYDTNDGKVRIYLRRKLNAGELLSFTSTNPDFPGRYVNLTRRDFDVRNSIEIEGLKPGTYPIQMLGFYRGFNTYTESPRHRRTVVITKPTPLEFSVTNTDVFCHRGSDGTITIKAKGGRFGRKYKYLLRKEGDNRPINESDWVSFRNRSLSATREVTEVVRGLPKGKYKLKVKDFNDCIAKKIIRDAGGNIIGLRGEKEEKIEIKEPKSPLKVVIRYQQNPSGFGFSDGEIVAQITGGTPLANGKYNFRWVHEKNGIRNTWTSFRDEFVSGEDGWFVTLTDAIDGNYSLRVSDANYSRANNSTADRDGCLVTNVTNTLIEPEKLVIAVQQTNPISCNPTNIYGNTANDGELTVTAKGGIPFSPLLEGKYKYKYIWKKKNAVGNYQVLRDEKASVLKNLEEGEYAVNIEDANGITVGTYVNNVLNNAQDATYNLVAPPLLKLSYTKQDAFCHQGTDGSIDITITGGTGDYSVLWSNNAITEDISGLTAGMYTVRVTDEKGCEVAEQIEIKQPDVPLTVAYTFFEPTFASATNGWIEATISGGTPLDSNTYNFNWTDNNGNPLNHKVTAVTNPSNYVIRLNGIGEGNYKLTIQDKNFPLASDAPNCTIVESEYFINDPEPLIAQLTVKKEISCNRNNSGNPYSDGELEMTVTGGVRLQPHENGGLDYYYSWKKETSPGVWTVLPAQTSNIATGLDEGNYAVNIKDANGIVLGEYQNNSLVIAKDLTQEIKEPEAIELTFKKQDVFCYEGSDGWAEVAIKGGMSPYQIKWDTGSNDAKISDLPKGVYEVTIIDNKGCTVVETIEIKQPDEEITVDILAFSTPIRGGESNGWVLAEVDGGTTFSDGSYTYYWQNEAGNMLNAQTTTSVVNGKFQIRLNAIPKGKYILTIEDANYVSATTKEGCTYLEKEFTLYDPIEAVISIETPISCHQNNAFNNPFSDGVLKVEVTGGVPFSTGNPYKYFWKKQNDLGVYEDLNVDSAILSNLSDGNYAINVEDSRGIVIGEYQSLQLIRAVDTLFTFEEPELLELELSATEISCNLGNDGTAKVVISGGIPPYDIQWSNGSRTEEATDLIAGNYLVFVTDARGCQATGNITLTPPGGLEIKEIRRENPSCFNGNDGLIEVSISGGAPPYTYSWDTGATTTTISNLSKGSYVFTLTDSNNCKAFVAFTLENPEDFVIDLGDDKVLCNDQVYSLDATISEQGTSYLWSSDNGFSSDEAVVEVAEGGVYSVKATTPKGCVIEDTITIISSNQDIEANFLVSSQAYLDEEIVIFNKSSLSQSSFEWILPSDVNIVETRDRAIVLKFTEVKTYEIGLRSKVGDCIQESYKKIVIEEPSELSDFKNESDLFIEQFTISPNPNDGNFDCTIKLIEASEISIRIFSIQGALMKKHIPLEVSEEYSESLAIQAPSGMYIVVLETPEETRVKRLIVR